ncbi:MAG: cytochrome c [Candidatus Eremiobacteraeota bacterium]|nr:cytochrome c [Candidatus Eremiobacteraeota bacterium]MBV8355503.1 cytochrome c [Candidatus Eremiobacteraeota bacterium]
MFAPLRTLLVVAVLAMSGAGCSRSASRTSTAGGEAASATPSVRAALPSAADRVRGKAIYTANCAQCHGGTGVEGGIGPSLLAESKKKNFAATVAWIENPAPPMPKLYPSPLSEKDVVDVTAYVQSLL